MTEALVPEDVARQLEVLGFIVHAWDDDLGAISGHGQQYVGTVAEVRAYLVAWAACQAVIVAKELVPKIPWTILGLASGIEIEPNGTVQISARPQCSFRGYRLAVPDVIAPAFTIDELYVGLRSQFPRAQSIRADVFACRIDQGALYRAVERNPAPLLIEIAEPAIAEFGRAFDMQVCLVAEEMRIVVTNTSDQSRVFAAFVLGRGA